MIENVVVTKFGSEANDVARKIFTSTTPWSESAGELIVYRNGVLQNKNVDYSIIDTYTLEFNFSVDPTEQVQMLVTRLSSSEFNRDKIIELDRVAKKLENKTQSSMDKRIFEEELSSYIIIHSDDIWSDDIDSNPAVAVSTGAARSINVTLEEDVTVGDSLGWFASDNQLITSTIRNWIPSRFGKKYIVRLYDGDGVEIPSADPIGWHWDYSVGYLFIANKNDRPKPYKLSGYVYTGNTGGSSSGGGGASNTGTLKGTVGTINDLPAGGGGSVSGDLYLVSGNGLYYEWDPISGSWLVSTKTPAGSGGSGGSSFWQNPVPSFVNLPTLKNIVGEVRLVTSESQLYRWDGVNWTKVYSFSSRFKDPVDNFINLPASGNENGDFRLVLIDNSIYRWSSSTDEWLDVLNKHNHDDRYFKKQEVNDLITTVTVTQSSHTHDNIYYRKEEVTAMVRWRPSVANHAMLPPYTENQDGDVILTRDTNTIWRFDYYSNPARWIKIASSQSTWKEPVKHFTDLPIYENLIGDTRLVLSDNIFYFWDGVHWLVVEVAEHTHDDLYYRKDYIDNLNLNWKAPVPNPDSLPSIGNKVGDVRISSDTFSAFFWNGNKWIMWTASPKWREPAQTVATLPAFNNFDSDVRYVKAENYLYIWDNTTSVWNPLKLPEHEHDSRYFTKDELLNGSLDTRYYIKNEVNNFFNSTTGHSHNGVDSKRIDYNNLLNIPLFSWKNYVYNISDLPQAGNTAGDTRIVVADSQCLTWDGAEWKVINAGLFSSASHNHDTLYYRKEEISIIVDELTNQFNSQLMAKSDITHNHDERYYSKTIVDQKIAERFDPLTGHTHNGKDSKRISYYDLLDIPPSNLDHNHDDRYFTKGNLVTAGQSEVNWDNLINKPDLANTHWKSPVQNYIDLPMINNSMSDIRLVLNDSDIYEWVGNQWVKVGHWANQYVVYWREPVTTYPDLPTINNVDGDVRLVLSENTLYRWNQLMVAWVAVIQTESDAQVYVNGLQLFDQGIEWVRTREREVQLKTAARAGDKVTLILKYEYKTIRKDFVAYSGQIIFSFATGYIREEFLAGLGQTIITKQTAYIKDGNALLVWLNGLIQRVNIDYKEIDTFSIQFLNSLQNQDRVITISLEHASGEGEYIREDQFGSDLQKDCITQNPFVVGSGTLIVFLNGLLQRVGNDYKEVNSSKISFFNSLKNGDFLTFITFNQEAISGIPDADQINLGNAQDNNWADGFFNFYPEYKVAYALDDINEILAEVAPPKPKYLQSLEFTTENIRLVSGYESIGNDYYEGVPGSYRNYITEDGTFYLYLGNGDAFADGDLGNITLYLNGIKVDEFNLYNAFVEANRRLKQSSLNYGLLAGGARENEGTSGTNGAMRNSLNNFISIMSVDPFNSFSAYQKCRARINMIESTLRKGYNYVYMTHQTDTRMSTSTTFKFFFDNSKSRPEIVDEVGLEETEIKSSKFVSGVKYYSIGDKFRTSFLISKAFNNTFSIVPATIEMTGLNKIEIEYGDENAQGISTNPQIGEMMDYNGYFRLNKYNEYNINSTLELDTFDPFGNGQSANSSPVNRLVNTFTNGSTDKIEYFRDELFRLPSDIYDTIPTIRKSVWNSTLPLTEGNALLFNMKLMYANVNFLGYKPQQTVDYSMFKADQFYYRAFVENTPNNNGVLKISGITEDNLIKNKIYLDIKLPTQTGWLSMNKYHDICTFSGKDDDGVLLNVNGNEFNFSTGTFSTAGSAGMIVVRIRLLSTSPNITYMELV